MGKGTVIGLGCVGVLVVVLIILAVSGVGIYNSLVSLDQAVNAQWGQVENVYQRRADLIPNLVATVSGAANFEKSTLEAVTNARASVGRVQVNAANLPNDPQAFARFEQAQAGLSSALSRLMVVVERYPELKANSNFRDLQAQLEGSENRITVERMRYNEKAQEYNTARLRFPNNLLAGAMGFKDKAYFKAQEGSEKAPQVQFNFGASPAAPAAPPLPASPRP
jgi:LemA protein